MTYEELDFFRLLGIEIIYLFIYFAIVGIKFTTLFYH
jgi:hypothetical protein